ncbi:MAG TPA: malectin domain-containing carbohydrate-binding protein [Steroidobacteraceae bacterium]|nr:malectin domain-containing carbohydrate-binding protein [Steroidobacteraceae bacterium]
MTSRDAERQELNRAVEMLGRTTRHGRLLEYLGTKYFSQQEAQLTEFDIARDVFGRSLENFDPAADAVVRVEAHRLRKKLRDIYEKDTPASGVQISLPAGTYVPKFTVVEPTSVRARRFPTWAWAIAGVAVVAAVGLIFGLGSRELRSPTSESGSTAVSTPVLSSAAPGAPSPLTELHIIAGYSGSDVIDNSGTRWTPDKYYAKGGVWSRPGGFIRGTSRPFLFKSWRTGEFGYDIPLAPGSYELRLFFASGQTPGDEKLSAFGIAMNGETLLSSYDISMSANGADTADELVFRDVHPSGDGVLRLWFTNETTSPVLNALEVVPGTPGKLKPIRILTQRTSFVDHLGQRWRADDYYQNGILATDRSKVNGTDDPELFSAERFGHFSYAIPVDRRGRYTVVLHFAEFYYGPGQPGGGGAGSRLFHVFCNGQTLLRDFDIYKEAGSLRTVTKSFPHIQPSAYGKINLMFEPVINNATVSGIEIIDESGS